MSEGNTYGAGHLVAAFLGGAAAGAAIALLTAPRSGRENREQIRGFVKERSDEVARLPKAVKAASGAAKEAFAQSLAEQEAK